ncbi:MAG: large conductance mechanosensitive channel protein MscL [Hyphomicrobiales bacterium]|nr:large conductance mechanosensitive channel protein MscL [Hyphomicrobiales bacterium]PCH49591.1 MAG: large conductance mechanosensitive channel protein MscL [Hyphomicrobiales bacterium]
MLNEFKAFIMKGNVMDLAVGVIIGGAFGAITKSLIGDVIMPVIGAVFGGLDFSNYFAPLSSAITETTLEAAKEQGAVLAYGSFITAVINFVILGFIVFMMVKAVNNLVKKEEVKPTVAPPAPSKDQVLLAEIRDALVAKSAPAKARTKKK